VRCYCTAAAPFGGRTLNTPHVTTLDQKLCGIGGWAHCTCQTLR